MPWSFKSDRHRSIVAVERLQLYTLIGVAFLLLVVLSYNNMMAKQERTRAPAAKPEEETGDWLCKFATHEGDVVGESVAVDGDRLILKQSGTFKSVALSAATVVGDEIHLSGDIDWDASREAGAAWHVANTKGQDDAVTQHLTRSEDVKAPALEAMQDRDEHRPTHAPGLESDSEE